MMSNQCRIVYFYALHPAYYNNFNVCHCPNGLACPIRKNVICKEIFNLRTFVKKIEFWHALRWNKTIEEFWDDIKDKL